MKSIILLCTCFLIMIQCKNPSTGQTSSASKDAAIKTFGAVISEEGSVTVDQVTDLMKGADTVALKISGTVIDVCQARGCWMNVTSIAHKGKPIFVRFKDYGFFMPKDCAGKKVIMDGIAFVQVTPVAELRHYAEDKGASKEEIAAITEPKEELRFLANGVLLHENN